MDNSFGKYIKQLRVSKGIKTKELATLVGVSRPSVTQFELGNRFPSDEVLQKIAEVLGDNVNKDEKAIYIKSLELLNRERHLRNIDILKEKLTFYDTVPMPVHLEEGLDNGFLIYDQKLNESETEILRNFIHDFMRNRT